MVKRSGIRMGTSGTAGLKKTTRGYTQSDEFTPHLRKI